MNQELFFDIETTGLPQKNANWETDFREGFPYIVSISWIYREQVYDTILNQEGRTIPEEVIKIHGITNEMAEKSQYILKDILALFMGHAMEADGIVCHNIYFDVSILKANVLREFQNDPDFEQVKEFICKALDKDKRVDTMQKSTKFCNIKQPDSNRIKWPTLGELYWILFKETFQEHNGKEDVLACRRAYYELKKLKIIE
jgi:DNA polymerase III epsilon subunit-like protein